MDVMEPKNCPMCGDKATADYTGGWSVACDNCYDCAPDAGRQLHGISILSRGDAVSDWNDQVREFVDARDEEAAFRLAEDRAEFLRGVDEDRRCLAALERARGGE